MVHQRSPEFIPVLHIMRVESALMLIVRLGINE